MSARLAACLKTCCLPPEDMRPAEFPRKSACIVGLVPSPGGFFNGLLNGAAHWVVKLSGHKAGSGKPLNIGTEAVFHVGRTLFQNLKWPLGPSYLLALAIIAASVAGVRHFY